jgi:nucleotidyltransferase/DNA polymerase involved in DNA repair
MKKYAEVAEVIRAVFKEVDPNFCPMSLDEAFLDITGLVEARQVVKSYLCKCGKSHLEVRWRARTGRRRPPPSCPR